jgi:hypothetical protein
MADREIYERALSELRRCEERAELLRAFVHTYEELASLGEDTADSDPKSRQTDIGSWEGFVIDALRHAGHPLRVKEIYELVGEALGIDSERPIDVLSTRINRSASFRKIGRGLYTLRNEEEHASGDDAQNVERPTDAARENNERTLQPESESQFSTPHLKTVSGMKLIPHIRKAILDSGQPLPRGGIVKALSDRGIKASGQDQAQSIATLMSRAKREFINLKPHGYWPRDVAYAPASHNPEPHQNNEDDEDHRENGSADAADRGSSAELWRS